MGSESLHSDSSSHLSIYRSILDTNTPWVPISEDPSEGHGDPPLTVSGFSMKLISDVVFVYVFSYGIMKLLEGV